MTTQPNPKNSRDKEVVAAGEKNRPLNGGTTAPLRAVTAIVNPLISYLNLKRETQLIRKTLEQEIRTEADFRGDLQVMKEALARMTTAVDEMIASVEKEKSS